MLSPAQSVSLPRSDGQQRQDRTAQDSHDGDLAPDRVLALVAALVAVAFPFASREGWKQTFTP